MKPVEHARGGLSELVRGFVYPTIPILGVVCIWAHAYAGSLESKLEASQRPHDEDSFTNRLINAKLAEEARVHHPVAGIHVSTLDDQN